MTSGWSGNRLSPLSYAWRKSVQTSGPPREFKERILSDALARRSPTRQSSRAFAWITAASSVLVAAAIFLAKDGPHHGEGRRAWYYAASTLGWTVIAVVSMWSAFGKGRSAVGRSRAWLLVVAAGTPAVLFAMMYAFAIADPSVTLVHPERIGYKCLALTLSAAALPLLGLLALRSGSDPVHPTATGAAFGAACGAAAGVMVEMWCPVGAVQHVAIGHVAPIVILALLGAAIGRRVLAMRRRATQRD
jgi:hypothetical protein